MNPEVGGGNLHAGVAAPAEEGMGWLDLLMELSAHLRLLVLVPIGLGAVALASTFAITPTFTAKSLLLPPQQQQSAAALAVQNIGALAGIAGGAALKSPVDQFASLMQSVSVEDKLIDQFKLMEVYEAKYRAAARRKLEANTRITISKKDGLIALEVDDTDPQRAAAIANAYVEQLEQLTKRLAVTEAQLRRQFFERQLTQTKQRFAAAQTALEAAGINEGALRAEPRAAAENYARLRAEITAAEVRMQGMRSYLAEGAPELLMAESRVSALRGQLGKVESVNTDAASGNYIDRYREFKYQETLYELIVRQYELAKLDEAREGAVMQVVDPATPPERKSHPRKVMIALGTTVATLLLLLIFIALRQAWRTAASTPASAAKLAAVRLSLRRALGRGV